MTAVEWLIEQICGEHTDAWKEEIKQALEIEKQQITDAFDAGVLSVTYPNIAKPPRTSFQYYETIKNETK
jgi:hypothetical protein